MGTPLWKALAERCMTREDLDPRLAALTQRLDLAQPAATLERQLVEEMADALRRSTDKVDTALATLVRIEHDVEAATAAEREDLVGAFNRQRTCALQAYWELVIHREALGFRRHDEIARAYPIPPRKET